MTADDVFAVWKFTDKITDASSIRCPECKDASPLADWGESEIYCESCEDYHSAIQCPKCLCCIDIVDNKPIEVVA